MTRIALTTLGCKANWADTEALLQALAGAGHRVVPFEEEADVYVVNTCTVTAVANAQSRQLLRRARRQNPAARVIATGCYGQTAAAELVALPEVDEVFGTADRAALVAALNGAAPRTALAVEEDTFGLTALKPQSRARAFLKIQEGCDRACAYCIIPQARGRGRSMPAGEVVEACVRLSGHHREIILTGIDLGQYGRGLAGGETLDAILTRLAARADVSRLRLGSLDPLQVSEPLVRLIAGGRICRHVHLSIQSGSDRILSAMRRPYRVADVAAAVKRLTDAIPGIAITGDWIAGFPGERDEDHAESMALLASLPLAGLHVFPFSPRRGTAAAQMSGQVPHSLRRSRAFELRSLARRKREAFLAGLIGEAFDVIVISREPGPDGTVLAVADTAVEVRLPAGTVPYGGMGNARITEVSELKVHGQWA